MASRHKNLLNDANVKRWYDNVSRGSPITADVYLRRLSLFLEARAIPPAELPQMGKKELHNLLLDTVTAMEKKRLSGGYIKSVVKALKSWLSFNDVVLTNSIKIRGAEETPTLQDERVPSQDELRRIFLSGDEKTRATCVLLAHSGVRPEVLGDYRGTDGLRLKDLPEAAIENGTVVFGKVPTLIRVRSNLSKKGHEYFTFLSEEGCEYLTAYFDQRIMNGEELTADSPVITPKQATKQFICTNNIGDTVRKAIRQAGLPWRPYVLRSYFDTQMMLAESKGLLIRDYRSFFMGHKGDIEATYTLRKRKLPSEVVEQMRTCYSKAQQYLQTFPVKDSTEESRKNFRQEFLLLAGLKPEEIKEEHHNMDADAFYKLIREKFRDQVNSQVSQKVVAVGEIEAHLTQGWQFVGLLPNEKAILKQAGGW